MFLGIILRFYPYLEDEDNDDKLVHESLELAGLASGRDGVQHDFGIMSSLLGRKK